MNKAISLTAGVAVVYAAVTLGAQQDKGNQLMAQARKAMGGDQ